MMKGISHMTFICGDLDRAEQLWIGVFGAKRIYDSRNRYHSLSPERFYLINQLWVVAMQGQPLTEKTYNHIAFEVDDRLLDHYEVKIKEFGFEQLPSRPRIDGEGRSIYFYDFDGHLFELHSGNLEDRLKKYHAIASEAEE